MKTIETKDTFGNIKSYEVVEKIPEGFFVWNIGNNMGSDEYIPLCELLSKDDKYSINPNTVKAIKLSCESVKLLREAASYGVESLKKAKQVVARKSEPKSCRAKKKLELATKVLPIYMQITE